MKENTIWNIITIVLILSLIGVCSKGGITEKFTDSSIPAVILLTTTAVIMIILETMLVRRKMEEIDKEVQDILDRSVFNFIIANMAILLISMLAGLVMVSAVAGVIAILTIRKVGVTIVVILVIAAVKRGLYKNMLKRKKVKRKCKKK